tara:strand:- start:148 stop:477 length:330 start_codon:yes stop_codon:yes gene_type:complete
MNSLVINGENIAEYLHKSYDYKGHGSGIEGVYISTDKVLEDEYDDNDWQEVLGFGYDDVITDWMTHPNRTKNKDVTMARIVYVDEDAIGIFNVYRMITPNEIKEIKIYW